MRAAVQVAGPLAAANGARIAFHVANAMQTVRFKMRVHKSHRIPERHSDGSEAGAAAQADDGYAFELLNEQVDLGPFELNQWWIDQSALYPSGQQSALMYRPVVDSYWSICCAAGTNTDRGMQETYLLARLFPYIRHVGVRDVFLDSKPFRRSGRSAKGKSAATLQEMLADNTQSMTLEEFHTQTGKLLVKHEYGDEDIQLHDEMSEQLLAPCLTILTDGDPEAAVAEMVACWQRWMNGIGRRRGNKDKKRILDALSYASKASFHQAYSAVWLELINMLWIKHRWDPETVRFHTFWHCIQRYADLDNPGQFTYLLRSHVLGLHPASATFMQTTAGRRLIGDWLVEESPDNFELLLGGLAVAVNHYFIVHDDYQSNRSSIAPGV